ncbi:MAG: hypothetical protein A2Z64_13375 [Betaproteobacteria bacterium RIFCSPLOWO2_02_67_12]|nr:MAG: hypothetical protein A2Z64_13375 [Betaproteobacteria bacterium RIFCSPLOWO2_02_67_12]OGA29669.1 MAG: hypothetical protein A3I65_02400 [Betaproteobacteria bacterium RIFCSPLOWO2_02_FULL_68_150]OGA71352.1 MAG: hypothetical protein A3F77_17470 [Betaproteobacteria bacterium RIFCSPLOWO2_12_FULL_67_28]
MKKTELEKLAAVKVMTRLRTSAVPERYAQGSASVPDRREQRRLDRERGLVPFAVKLDSGLARRLRALAGERSIGLNELVDELLRKGLGETG